MTTYYKPILWWKGEDNPSESQEGLDATWAITPAYDAGKVNQAFRIDHTDGGAGNDYSLSVANNALFNFEATGTFSIKLWIKVNNNTGNQRMSIISKGRYMTGDDWGIFLDNAAMLYVLTPGVISNTSGQIPDTDWHEILATYNNGAWKLYLDGVDVLPAGLTANIGNTIKTLYIGDFFLNGDFDGLIDEIRIYDQIISTDNNDQGELIMIKELELILVKKQATFGTQGDDLTGSDYFPALPDSKIEVIPAFTDVESVSAIYDQDLSVKGFVNANAELSCYMRSLGAATAPDYGLLAQAAGFVQAGPTAGKYTYTAITTVSAATTSDLEAWRYLGGIGENASILTKIGNVVGNWKIALDVGKPVIFSLTGAKGIFVSEAAATMMTEVVKDRTLIPPALPVTVSINSVVYKIMKFSCEGGNTVEQYVNCAATYGFGDSEITKKKIKFSFTCYADASLANPLDAVIAGDVVSDVEITWGKTLYTTKIDIDDPQFTDCKVIDIGGLTGWEVSGIASQNDLVITQNNDYA